MSDDTAGLHAAVIAWYDEHARELPWRRPGRTGWEVLVSEIMLQQTQVDRVLPVYLIFLERWPTPRALAEADPADVLRAWGRLGYPRRALRLQAAAAAVVERHGGQVPRSYDDLLALPGVGDYTAAAVASFAHGDRHVVLDTNVRRVLGRVVGAEALPRPSVTAAERRRAERLLPDDAATAARWAVATMELGALVCTARSPSCGVCPVEQRCAWVAAGRPAYAGPARPRQGYDGTDRQARGRLLAALRDADGPLRRTDLTSVWAPDEQRERAIASLVDDGLLVAVGDDRLGLPSLRAGSTLAR